LLRLFQKLRFELKDTDLLNQDDAVGGGEIDLDDFVTKGQKVTIPINGVEGATLTMEKTTPIKFKLAAK
jgi:archaellin